MIIAVFTYALAMTLANLLIVKLGVWVSPISSFLLIGLTLVLRDWLHVRLKAWQMGCLIFVSGLITYALNQAAAQIAIASSVSFTIAAIADWVVFIKTTGSWFKRSNISNAAGSAIDSFLFPTMAFGVIMPEIVAAQFAAKMIGGLLWSYVFNKSKAGEK